MPMSGHALPIATCYRSSTEAQSAETATAAAAAVVVEIRILGPIGPEKGITLPSPVEACPSKPPHAEHHKDDHKHDLERGNHVETPSPEALHPTRHQSADEV